MDCDLGEFFADCKFFSQRRKGRKDPLMVRQTIDNPRDAAFQQHRIEIDEQSETLLRQPQICQHLFPANRMNIFHRFKFNNDAIVNQQINPEPLLITNSVIDKRHRNLTLHLQPRFFNS